MRTSLIATILSFLFASNVLFGQEAQLLTPSDTVPFLCGTYLGTDSSQLITSIEFKSWNTYNMESSFDEMLFEMGMVNEDSLLRPDSKYFVSGDSLYLEVDKGFICYKIKGDSLLGLGPWISNNILIRNTEEEIDCPTAHVLTQDEKEGIALSRAYYKLYFSTDYAKGVKGLEQLCEMNYGPACMTLGGYLVTTNQEMGLKLMDKACNLGHFGNYACYKYGEILDALGKRQEALEAYQKSCEGGHAVGCFAAKMK